jgi:hypothetical protein
MPSTHKKVIVRKHDRDSVSGHVSPSNFVVDGKLELLNTSGNVVAIDLRDIKAVYFVREFSDTDLMLRKTFTTRPRTEGLVGAPEIQRQRSDRRHSAQRPDPESRRRIPDEPSRPALEHATSIRAPRSIDLSNGASRNRSQPTAAAEAANPTQRQVTLFEQ